MWSILSIIGLIWALKVTLNWLFLIFHGFKTYIWPKYVVKNDEWLRSLGSWAIVTGCAHGIGLAYAKELAKRGINLILIDKYQHELLKISKCFEKNYSIRTCLVEVDLSRDEIAGSGSEFIQILNNLVRTKDIGLLVNNVGISHTPSLFHLTQPESLEAIINVNVRTCTLLTRVILPIMLKKNKGAIVNVCSSITGIPSNAFCVYGSTKAYLDKFTATLRSEYKNTNLFFQSLSVGGVRTRQSVNGIGKHGMNFYVDALKYSKCAIRTLGFAKHTCGHWYHGLEFILVSIVPRPIFNLIAFHFADRVLFEREKENFIQDNYIYDDLDLILMSND